MKFDDKGVLRAINPESGFFGVAPGTNAVTNGHAMESFRANAIFTNVALTPAGDVWWEGMTKETPARLTSWLRRDWTPDSLDKAAHPNSRFTAPAAQCPIIDPAWQDPQGVPISAIIFGGRRSETIPLVTQSLDWAHGTFLGATMMSEQTAAAEGKVGDLRADPMAMKPFCGYNMADYWGHWLSMEGRTTPDKLPKIFFVNWFRKDAAGKFMWPGFGDNARVLSWIFGRSGSAAEAAKAAAVETPIGFMPDVTKGALPLDGLKMTPEAVRSLFAVDKATWKTELELYAKHLGSFGAKLPKGLGAQLERVKGRFTRA
jgi:phosphoenolpyruvate carboxykinase (GTP)